MKINSNTDNTKNTLLKDSEWAAIDGEACRVISFDPFGGTTIKEGKITTPIKLMPYASVTFECKKASEKIKGFITHKTDFTYLWTAFKERGIKPNEEVIFFWTKKHYKYKFLKFISGSFPRLWVMVCHKGAYELMTDPSYKPELQGEARFEAERPIVEWKHEVME